MDRNKSKSGSDDSLAKSEDDLTLEGTTAEDGFSSIARGPEFKSDGLDLLSKKLDEPPQFDPLTDDCVQSKMEKLGEL